ncbi:MAG: hypothetical protein LBT83_00225 [Tannerella sp.]|jgi:hypothetical protein|nr:hypothetical protein [Tannerella sp.]
MFGAKLERPEFIKSTGLINLEYTESGIRYDISSAGRGFQQTLLLFAYLFARPNTILGQVDKKQAEMCYNSLKYIILHSKSAMSKKFAFSVVAKSRRKTEKRR